VGCTIDFLTVINSTRAGGVEVEGGGVDILLLVVVEWLEMVVALLVLLVRL
jgi:hypothetical protein